MIRKSVAMALLIAVLAACGAPSAGSSSGAISSSEAPSATSSESTNLVENGKFVFKQIPDPLFTMDYEPRQGSVTMQHFGMNFPDGVDTDYLGDSGFDSVFNLHNAYTDQVYGTVKITTAPADLAAYYNTTDPAELLNQMQATFFTTQNYYSGLRKNIVEDFEYELVIDESGVAFDGGWNAFYLEFIDKDSGNRGLRFYMCNDEIKEKFYSMTISVNVPMDDAQTINLYRDIIFTLHPREA